MLMRILFFFKKLLVCGMAVIILSACEASTVARVEPSHEAAAPKQINQEGEDSIVSVDWSDGQRAGWFYLIEELEVQELLAALSVEHRPENYILKNVNVITMESTQPQMGVSVQVSDGRVSAVEPSAELAPPDSISVIDGGGMWLIPGLTDMHVHNLESHSQHILNIAMGVTTVRDLDGFPFLLEMRDAIAENLLLAPTMYVSGTILNGSDFGGYAQRIDTVEEARKAVGEQVISGYDFIKTHNSLSIELFDAITDEASLQKIDVVGHIPVPVSVAHAVNSGMRTFEHFKGYIIDSTLMISEENYVAATRGAEIWNTPTFSTYRNHLRGDEAAAVLSNNAEMQYVSPTTRAKWAAFSVQETDDVTRLRQNIYPMSRQIFSELMGLPDARFLAGTDSGSYELMPPGFMLLEEVKIFQELGMTPYEALQTATTNPAEAMRRAGLFGVIAEGAAADFILLKNNPLDDVSALTDIEAIGLRGIWIDADERINMLERLKTVYKMSQDRMTKTEVMQSDLDGFLLRLNVLHENGFVFRDHYLDYAASMYMAVGRDGEADIINAMKVDPDFGFSWFRF